LNQGLYLHYLRPMSLNKDQQDAKGSVIELVNREIEREYGTYAIFFDFYLPTALTAVAGLTLAFLTCYPATCCGPLSESTIDGLRFGALGALVYVLLTLSERTYQRDITPGAAAWSAVQLVIGPIFGAVLAETLLETSQVSQFTQRILYFFAGMVPRQIAAFIQEAGEKFFTGRQEPVSIRTLPLTNIRGINPRIAQRLTEEGIEDVYMLAMASPIALSRSTPFSLRQVTKWIDEALLFATFPAEATKFQELGITGGMDLVEYVDLAQTEGSRTRRHDALKEVDSDSDVDLPDREYDVEVITPLTNATHIDQQVLLRTMERLYDDVQLNKVWSIYNSNLEKTGKNS
jgi:hypothetical protein